MKLNTFRNNQEPKQKIGGTTFTPPGREDFEPRKLNVPQFKTKLVSSKVDYLPYQLTMECLLKTYK